MKNLSEKRNANTTMIIDASAEKRNHKYDD